MRRAEAAPSLGIRARQARALAPWVALAPAVAYLAVVAATFSDLAHRVYWDSDVATAGLVAEDAGDGTILLVRVGSFTSLWFSWLTRSLPFHRELWEVAPYLFALGSAALLAWASWRLAGRWAAAMTATLAVAVSPFVNFGRLALNFHSATWVATVALGAILLWLTSPSARHLRLVFVIAAVIGGVSFASDRFFAVVGLLPFALAGLFLLFVVRDRARGGVVVGSAAAALPIAWATAAVMDAWDVKVIQVPGRFAEAGDLWPNFGRLLELIVQLVNGDYFFDAQLGVRSALSFACALLVLAALPVPFLALRRDLRSRRLSERSTYLFFWVACIVVTSSSYVVSSEGTHPGYYVIPVLYALAATVPILLAAGETRRLLCGTGIAVVATASLVNLTDGATRLPNKRPPVMAVADRIVELARKHNAAYGYADYWDAAPLTWGTDHAVEVRPVVPCETGVLCAYWFNIVSTWFQPHDSSSFVLRDSESLTMTGDPPDELGKPSATYVIDENVTMFVYPFDVARRLDYSQVRWPPPDL